MRFFYGTQRMAVYATGEIVKPKLSTDKNLPASLALALPDETPVEYDRVLCGAVC